MQLFSIFADTVDLGRSTAPATPDTGSNTAGVIVLIIILLLSSAFVAYVLVANWKIYTKAGQPGWASIIPIYNLYVLLKIVGRPWWWLLLMLVPVVSIVVQFIMYIDLAKSFGKSTAFGFWALCVFSVVGICWLGHGSATYVGPGGSSSSGGSVPPTPSAAPPVAPPVGPAIPSA